MRNDEWKIFKKHLKKKLKSNANKEEEDDDKGEGKRAKVVFESRNCLIFQMDCLKAMKIMSKSKKLTSSIDLTITSPPYNIGKEYEKVSGVETYQNWCGKWMNEIYNLTTKDGALLMNVGYLEIPERGKCIPISYLLWDKTRFFLVQQIIWTYENGVASKKRLSPRHEEFMWFVKDEEDYCFNLDPIRIPTKNINQRRFGRLRNNQLGKNPGDVWPFKKVSSGCASNGERTAHPAQFPMSIIERCMLAYSDPEDLVLDPFMGSGTTAEVAMKNGRKVIGFELSDKYCDIIQERLSRCLKEIRAQKNDKKRPREVDISHKKTNEELKREKDANKKQKTGNGIGTSSSHFSFLNSNLSLLKNDDNNNDVVDDNFMSHSSTNNDDFEKNKKKNTKKIKKQKRQTSIDDTDSNGDQEKDTCQNSSFWNF